MVLTLDVLRQRGESLSVTLKVSEETLKDLNERVKTMKKEISNLKGAIIEIDQLIETYE